MSRSLAAEIARLRPVTIDARRRDRIEAVIEHLVEALNLIDGDPDIEDGDEDRCEVLDDAPISGTTLTGGYSYGAGDPGDQEDDDPAEMDDEPEDEHDREGVV